RRFVGARAARVRGRVGSRGRGVRGRLLRGASGGDAAPRTGVAGRVVAGDVGPGGAGAARGGGGASRGAAVAAHARFDAAVARTAGAPGVVLCDAVAAGVGVTVLARCAEGGAMARGGRAVAPGRTAGGLGASVRPCGGDGGGAVPSGLVPLHLAHDGEGLEVALDDV